MKRYLRAGACIAGLLAVFGAVILLSACAKTPPPATLVATAEQTLTAADQVALVYVTLPQCPATSGVDGLTCSQEATILVIKADAQKAHDAVKAAEAVAASGGSPVMTDANAAIAAFQAAVPAAPPKS